jgi:hypothetical protein
MDRRRGCRQVTHATTHKGSDTSKMRTLTQHNDAATAARDDVISDATRSTVMPTALDTHIVSRVFHGHRSQHRRVARLHMRHRVSSLFDQRQQR